MRQKGRAAAGSGVACFVRRDGRLRHGFRWGLVRCRLVPRSLGIVFAFRPRDRLSGDGNTLVTAQRYRLRDGDRDILIDYSGMLSESGVPVDDLASFFSGPL